MTPPVLVEDSAATRPEGVEPQAEAQVRLGVVIDETGAVTEVSVVESGGPAFDEAARAAARDLRFEPAREGDTPIAVEIEFVYDFEPLPPPLEDGIDEVETVSMIRVRVEPAQTELSAEDGERVAGVQGDAIKAAQVLGGVGRPALGTGELVLWGAAPEDSRRQVDWILVPRLFHLGGGRSILPTPRVERVAVTPGGFGPAYGRALGGLVVVHTAGKPDRDRRVGAYGRVDPIDAGVGVDTFAGERGHLALSARRGLLTDTFGRIAPASTRAVVPLPRSWDYQARAEVHLRSDLQLTVLGLGVEDRVDRALPARTEDVAFEERRFAGFHRLGARLGWTADDGSTAEVAGWFGVDRDRIRQDFGDVDVGAEQDLWRGGLRLQQTRRLHPVVSLRWGVDAELVAGALRREGALTLPAREGDIVAFGQPPGDRVAEDRWGAVQGSVAAHAALPFAWADDRWLIEPGVRIEPTLRAGDRILPVRPVDPEVGYAEVDVLVQPRGHVRWSPTQALSIFAAGGRYAQAPDPADLSPVFGNPRLAPAMATHAVAGVTGRPIEAIELGATGFFTRSEHRAGRTDDPTPPAAGLLQADMDGRRFGGQVVARAWPVDRLSLQMVYAWSRSQRRDPGEDAWRRFDFDQTHLVQALGSWTHPRGFELGARAALTSGFPRTDVIAAVPNVRAGGWDPIFGDHNAIALPLFFELSARVGYTYTAGWGSVAMWLDVQNATNRANASEFFYSVDYGARGLVRGLPILPMLGVEVRT